MKWLLLIMLSTPALAQEKCDQLKSSLKSIETKLQSSKIAGCGQLDAKSMGLPELAESAKVVFDGMKCQSLGSIDAMLSNLETQLVLLDELKDLRDQAVATKRTLENATNWTTTEQRLSQQFTKDVTLGAAIQQVIEHPALKELMAGTTNGPAWGAKFDSFCQGQGANAASPLCGLWKSFGANASVKALNPVDLYAFLDELRPLLAGGELPAEKKTELLAMLRLEKDGKATDFKTYQTDIERVNLYNSLSATSFRTLDAPQTRLLRQQTLRVPDEKDNLTSLRSLVARLSNTQDMLKVKSATTLFKNTMTDATNRHEARLKARWSALYGKLAQGRPIPCLDSTEDNFSVCLQVEWDKLPKTTLETQDELFKSALFLGAQQLKDNRRDFRRCAQDDVVQAWVKGTTVPAECEKDKTLTRAGLDLNRQVLLALRERIKTQEDKRLRFREYAAKELQESCSPNVFNFSASNKCQGLPGQVEFGPAVTLVADAMPIFLEGMKANQEISTADCPAGQQDEYTLLCNMIFRPSSQESGSQVGPRVSPTTLPTDAPTRKKDPIIADTLARVANEIASTWANNRMNQMAQPTNQWMMPTYRPMPYSQPISLSMSDYVMATSTFYGGYGQYYKCDTCGFGTSPAAFNSFWGMGSSSTGVAGMGGLGGTSMSSRFFGGNSLSAGFASF